MPAPVSLTARRTYSPGASVPVDAARRVERHAIQSHAERAARLHRVNRVRAEVEHDLVNLRRVAAHRGIVGVKLQHEPNVVRQRGGENLQRFGRRRTARAPPCAARRRCD